MNGEPITRKPSTLILTLFASYTVAAAVLFTPALPDLMQSLNLSHSTTHAMIVLFLLGYAFGQLIYGPVNNKYGRKAALYLGFGIALLGEALSIIACYQQSIALLILGRFLTATGACAGYAVTFAIVRDCYQTQKARKTLSTITFSFAVAPGVSILFGGFLANYIGWESAFYSLFIYGVVLFSLISFLPETSTSLDMRAYELSRIFLQYATVLKNKKLVFYGLACSVWSAFLYTYYAEAPFIAEQDFYFSAQKYGVVSLITAVGYILGNCISIALAKKFKANQVIHLGLSFMFIGIFLLALISFNWLHWVYLYFFAVAVCFAGGSLFFSNAIALALENVSNIAMASSMFGMLNMLGSVICTGFVGILGAPHVSSFFILYVSFLIILLALNFFAEVEGRKSIC